MPMSHRALQLVLLLPLALLVEQAAHVAAEEELHAAAANEEGDAADEQRNTAL